ncbi:MAG: hypothetical protein ACK4IY_06145, partial [Chitinophagales bacterium]
KNDGDAKGLAVILNGTKKQPVYLLANTSGPLEAFSLTRNNVNVIACAQSDAYAEVKMKNGRVQRVELYNGSGYLSQSSKFIRLTPEISEITVYNYAGESRNVYPATIALK